MHDPDCDFCTAGSGVCTECEGCFGEHCQCDPCQHGKARANECVFCNRFPEIMMTRDETLEKAVADIFDLGGSD